MPIITFLSDFGTRDSYVAELKGVILTRVSDLTIVDVTHDVPPGDVRAAQYLLSRAWSRFPRGTVHLAVVDPGVGTARRALAGAAEGHFFIGPDNGVFSFLRPDAARWVSLPIPDTAAPTFHGRDVFAPAAASLLIGIPPERLGARITDPVRSPLPVPGPDGEALVGEVMYVDRYGTLVTNLPGEMVLPAAQVRVAWRDLGPVRRTFADAASGEVVALIGSGGTVEIAVRDGSAAEVLELAVGAQVRLEAARQ